MTEIFATADEPTASGVRLAAERLERHGIPLPELEEIQPALIAAVGMLNKMGTVSARAAEMFLESVTVASVMRLHYGEPQLNGDDIAGYLNASRSFLNSFWHV